MVSQQRFCRCRLVKYTRLLARYDATLTALVGPWLEQPDASRITAGSQVAVCGFSPHDFPRSGQSESGLGLTLLRFPGSDPPPRYCEGSDVHEFTGRTTEFFSVLNRNYRSYVNLDKIAPVPRGNDVRLADDVGAGGGA